MRNFVVFRRVEIGLLAIGLTVATYYPSLSLCKVIGFGLSMQACLLLILDFFAENRGKVDLNYLKNITYSGAPAPMQAEFYPAPNCLLIKPKVSRCIGVKV
jgi:hypothetical protein